MAFSKTINFSITIAAIFFVSFTIVDGGDPKEQVPSSSDQLLGTPVIHHYIDKNGEKLPSTGKVDTTGYKIVVQEDALFKEDKFNNYYGKSGLYPPPSFKPAAQSSKLEMTGHKIVVQEDGTGDSEEFVVV